MVKKMTLEQKVDKLTTTVEKGFAAVAEDFKAMNDRFDRVEMDLRHIKSEIAYIHKRLNMLEEQYGHMRGITKEIDELRGRLRAVEKQLLRK